MGEIGNLWVTIGARTTDLQRGLSQAKTGLEQTKTGANSLSTAFGKLATPVAGITAGLGVLAGAYKLTAGRAMDYAKQVRDLQRDIGGSAEDISGLIQAADDVNISFSTMQAAMRAAVRIGIKPTVENISLLADEYNRLAPGVERTAYLMKNFGRAGAEMGALLEQGSKGIAESTEAADRLGMILDQQAVDSARQFEIAMDDLGDAASGVAIQFGNELIPVLTSALNTINLIINAPKTKRSIWEQHRKDLQQSALSWEDYTDEVMRSGEVAGVVAEGQYALYKNMREFGEFDPSFLKDWEDGYFGMSEAVYKVTTGIGELDDNVLALTEKNLMRGVTEDADIAVGAIDDVTLAIKDLSMAGMGKETLENLATQLSEGKITQEEYNAAAEYTMRTLLGMSDTEIAGFEKVAGLNADLANSDISAWDYAAAMQAVYTALADIKGLGQIVLPLATGGNIGAQSGGEQEGYGGASGLSMIVPAGYPNDSFNVKATSGEKVTIEPLGGSGKSGGEGVKIYGNVTFVVPQGVTTARGLFQSLRETAGA